MSKGQNSKENLKKAPFNGQRKESSQGLKKIFWKGITPLKLLHRHIDCFSIF